MELETLRSFLAWCSTINLILLLFWWGFFMLGGDWLGRLHGKWFGLSKQSFDAIHYSGMAFFKILILVFNVIPYLVLRLFF